MDSVQLHRRPKKFRRTGRHTTPSQVENLAEKATKAAPAVAIAGALVAVAPQAHAAENASAKATTVAEQVHTDAVISRSQPAARTYTVRSGDTLSAIAARFYGNAADWPGLYHANEAKISNPNDIYVGEVLTVPASLTANVTLLCAQARPARQGRDHAHDVRSQPERHAELLRARGAVGVGRRLVRRGLHGRGDRHGRIRRQPVRPQPDQRLRLLADQRLARPGAGHLQRVRQRPGRDRHLR